MQLHNAPHSFSVVTGALALRKSCKVEMKSKTKQRSAFAAQLYLYNTFQLVALPGQLDASRKRSVLRQVGPVDDPELHQSVLDLN